jgi:hypothetical protein
MKKTNGGKGEQANEPGMKVQISCQTDKTLPLEEIIPFQGEFKDLTAEDFEKLKGSIIKYGLSFPSFVWRKNGEVKCLDGHQRSRTLSKMKEEGWEIPPVPVVYVDAKDEKEAKEKVLLLSSQYGKYSNESLYEFIKLSDLEWASMQGFLDLPQIDMKTFFNAYIDSAQTEGDEFATDVQHADIKQLVIQGPADAFTTNFIDKLHKFLQPNGISIVGDDESRPKREAYKKSESRSKRRNEEWGENDDYKAKKKTGSGRKQAAQ